MRAFTGGLVATALLFGLVLAGCDLFGPDTGVVEVRVTDAPAEYEITSVMVNFVEAAIQETDQEEWTYLEMAWLTRYDIIKLVGHEQLIASAEVAAGGYSSIRLSVERMDVAMTGDMEMVIVPSEPYVFEQPFEVIGGETTIILLDFDVDKSVAITDEGDISIKPIENIAVSVRQAEAE
ncbi:MAG: DUF4382 domain-containing protein [Dehalococcoidales bacterium]|nr:DUF4382 domain-containing protein [Dehalococcoidales bacterium]